MKRIKMTSAVASALLAAGLCTGAAFAVPAAAPLADKSKAETPAHAEAHEAHRVVAVAADRALDPNGAVKVLEMVDRNDRDRIEKNLTKGDEKEYQKVVDAVRSKWKQKYGEEFSAEGHVADFVSMKPTITGTGHDQKAVIQLPSEPGEKAYELHLTREKSGYWRINLPDTVDGKTFYKNMMDSVGRLSSQVDKFPADKGEAYQRASTEVLHEMAFPSGGAK